MQQLGYSGRNYDYHHFVNLEEEKQSVPVFENETKDCCAYLNLTLADINRDHTGVFQQNKLTSMSSQYALDNVVWMTCKVSVRKLSCVSLPGVQLQPADVHENSPWASCSTAASLLLLWSPEGPLHKYSQPPVTARCKPLTLTNYSSYYGCILWLIVLEWL